MKLSLRALRVERNWRAIVAALNPYDRIASTISWEALLPLPRTGHEARV